MRLKEGPGFQRGMSLSGAWCWPMCAICGYSRAQVTRLVARWMRARGSRSPFSKSIHHAPSHQ